MGLRHPVILRSTAGDAAREADQPFIPDYNGKDQEGFGRPL
jgi:hypothetical protein